MLNHSALDLDVSHFMRYINSRVTYLLTYTEGDCSLRQAIVYKAVSRNATNLTYRSKTIPI